VVFLKKNQSFHPSKKILPHLNKLIHTLEAVDIAHCDSFVILSLSIFYVLDENIFFSLLASAPSSNWLSTLFSQFEMFRSLLIDIEAFVSCCHCFLSLFVK
jgi:hypothetical protein